MKRRAPSRPATVPTGVQSLGWERWEPMIQHSLRALDPPLLRALRLAPGQRVLDIGSGSGDPALAIAQWIGPRGTVLGIDSDAGMIDLARRRARMLGAANLRFRVADMVRFRYAGPRFHRVSGRLAIMFASDVPRALGVLRDALVPGGIAAFIVWAEAERNTALSITAAATRPFLDAPPPDPEAGPHPMRFGRRESLPRALRAAGFRNVRSEEVRMAFVYQSPEQFTDAFLETSSAARALYARLGPRDRVRVRERMRRAAAKYRDGALVRLPGVARVVSAVR